MKNSPPLNRAKLVDEPFVLYVLREYWGSQSEFATGTVNEDFNHMDIVSKPHNSPFAKIIYDVKRNSSKQWNSQNFLFQFKNNNCEMFPFKENGYFAYIDDIDGSITILSHTNMKKYVETRNHYNSKLNENSQFILIPKIQMKKDAYCVIKGNENRIKYLERNRNEIDFNL